MSSELVPVRSVLVPSHDEVVVERIGRVAPMLGIMSLACLLSLPWKAPPVVPGEHVQALIGMGVFFVGAAVAGSYPFCVPAGATARVFAACGCCVLLVEIACAWRLTG